MVDNGYGRERLRDIKEKEVREEQEEGQTKHKASLAPQEYQRTLKGPHKGFVVPGLPKVDIDAYLY